MTGPAVRGRCPSLLAPMESGDGLLVRVKPRAATLAARQAEAVAAAAERHGNGIVEPTNRGHLQLRGLARAGVDAVAAEMAQIGLAAAHPRAEAVRNVLADPLGPDDPGARFDSHRLAHRLSAVLETEPALHGLPDKFGILVDAGAALPLAGRTADIMIRPCGDGVGVALDGGDRLLAIAPSGAEETVRKLLAAFLSWAGRASPPPRMRAMTAALGAGGVFDAAGLGGEGRPCTMPAAPASRPPAGFMPVAERGCFLAGAPFGALDASALRALAQLSRRFADGTIRVTPWKALALWGVAPSEAGALGRAAAEAGLVVDAGDARHRIVACAGRPRCASARADSRADAALIAASGAVPAGLLHISGCAKGCAHPGAAPLTLVATADGYDLVRGGRAGDRPERSGLAPVEAVRGW